MVPLFIFEGDLVSNLGNTAFLTTKLAESILALSESHVFLYNTGGVAAYNFGVSNVRSWDRLDIGSTGNDYSNDVIARAQHLINRYNW